MSWETVALGEIIELQNGYAFKSNEYTDDGYFLMRITNVQQGFIQNNNPKYVNISNNPKLNQFILNTGDILISLTGDVGRVGVLKEENLPAVLNQRVARIILKEPSRIDKNYLFNLLNSDMLRTQIESLGHGAAQLNVSTKDILAIKISLPPISTQQKIVEKLDAIFAEIDKATAAAEANVMNAEELFQSYLTEVFEECGDGWVEKPLKEISKVINGFAFKSQDFISNSGIKVIKISNVGVGHFLMNDEEFLPKSYAYQYSSFAVPADSIVIPLTRTIINEGLKVAIVPNEYNEALLNQRVAAIVANKKIIDNKLIYYYLSSKVVKNYVLSNVNALMQPNLSIKDLLVLPVPIPPINEQKFILEKLENMKQFTNDIKLFATSKNSEFTKLRASIFQNAFNGELIKG